MYTKIFVPLDGSKTAEQVLPYARTLSEALKLPIELLAVIDLSEIAVHVAAGKARYLDTLIEAGVRSSEEYLGRIARTISHVDVKCTIEKGRPDEVIVEKAAADKSTLISMATHGRSGINRWLMGSVAEKVLRSTMNPLLLIRPGEQAPTEGRESLRSVIVPLDGSDLAESVLPAVARLATELNLGVILFRAYSIPYNAYANEGYYAMNLDAITTVLKEETVEYLEKNRAEVKKLGVTEVSYVAKEGFAADEIISLGRNTANHLIAMCTHGRSGVQRWALGSVTETVVRHSGDPVLVLRAPS
jgi:nucleotide-binding universal stress UspA family protein